MSILIDIVPETVFIDGIEYDINTNFRNSILFELTMQDKALLDEEKIDIALNLYYPEIPQDIHGAVEEMLDFYKCNKQEVESLGDGNTTVENIYSYEYDDDYIYSAFLTQYRIDLQDIEHLHWWKFKAMFKSLKEDNLISKIMGYRSMKINNDMSDSEKAYYKQMKQLYALPDFRTEEQKQLDFDNTLSSLL